jgi:aerobic carbon-monoxide dehydrogenase medium subunit
MIPQPFDYSAPATLQEAFELVAGGERKILAGGMSLIPLMKLRLATPEHVVDLGRVPDLNQIEENGQSIRIGATATHHDIETSPLIRARCPLLAEAANHIGDAQVRNRGTIGGSIAHADPAADYPAALLALEAQVRLASREAERTVYAADFFLDPFTTAMQPGEILVQIQVPFEGINEGYRYQKVPHPASGFAIVGIAVRIVRSGGKIALARIGVTGMGPHAFRALAAEKLLEDGAGIDQAVASIAQDQEANSDLYASSEYRRHLTRVYAKRAIAVALTRAS